MSQIISFDLLAFVTVILFIAVIFVLIFSIKTASRLSKSIALINDLYKLNQQQAHTIEQFSKVEKSLNDPKSQVSILHEKIKQDLKHAINSEEDSLKTQAISQQVIKLEQDLIALQNKVGQLEQDDPQLKMYSRASQLAKSGASVQDIVESCDLPQAEAEVLVSLQSKSRT